MEEKGKLWNWWCWGKKGTWRKSQEINENETRLQKKWLWWEVLRETKVDPPRLIMCNGLWTVVRKERTWSNARWKSKRKYGTGEGRKLKEKKKKDWEKTNIILRKVMNLIALFGYGEYFSEQLRSRKNWEARIILKYYTARNQRAFTKN